MGTTQPQPALTAKADANQQAITTGTTDQLTAEAALVKAAPRLFDGSDLRAQNSAVFRIPIEVDVSVPVRNFRVRDLLALAYGYIVESQWLQGEDMPLSAPGAQLAWAEFEVIDEKLGIRITRLA